MTEKRIKRQSVRTVVDLPPGTAISGTPASPNTSVPETPLPPAMGRQLDLVQPGASAVMPVVEKVEQPEPVQPVVPISAEPVVKRVKLGWQMRVDLIRTCKQLALDNNMHDYEVLEALLDEALEMRRQEEA